VEQQEKALRKFVEVAARLTEEQRRELLDHLEESVEAKTRVGMNGLDAIVGALEDLGNH